MLQYNAVVVQPVLIARGVCKEVEVMKRGHCISSKAFIMALQKQHWISPCAVQLHHKGPILGVGLQRQIRCRTPTNCVHSTGGRHLRDVELGMTVLKVSADMH